MDAGQRDRGDELREDVRAGEEALCRQRPPQGQEGAIHLLETEQELSCRENRCEGWKFQRVMDSRSCDGSFGLHRAGGESAKTEARKRTAKK